MTNLKNITFKKIRLFNRNAIKVSFKPSFDLIVVHLDDVKEENRIKAIEDLKHELDTKSVIIAGDFNSIAKSDILHMSEMENEYRKENPKISEQLGPIIDEMKVGTTIELLEGMGFKSAMPNFTPTMPTKKKWHKKPFLKLDHILYKGDIKIKKVKILKGSIYDDTSNHYPVVFDIYPLV